MKGRVKEDEKNEKIIRGLLKLPANRRCINCNSLGPQYVCITFWTFVCVTCSGIHREFTHRVKSVSMSTFTSEEVIGLRGGGNECAKEVYFKQWDWQRQFLPDNCNIEGLRKFIKHVYVDRRYTGEKSTVDGPSTPKMVEREDTFTHRSGLHSMPYLDIYERHCIERSGSSERSDERDSGNNYGERRNPGHGKESEKHVDRKRISSYFEVVDDRFHDHITQTTKSEANWLSNRTHNLQRRPSNQYKALDSSRPRQVRSLRDILDRIPTLQLTEALKEDGGRSSDCSVHMQRTISTIETRHIDGNSMEPKRLNSMASERKNLESPVNISSDPEPASQAQQSPKSTRQPIPKPTSSPNSNNSVSIDSHTKENQSKAASNAKYPDSLVPAAKPMENLPMKLSTGGVLGAKILNMARTPRSRGVSSASPLSNVLTSSPTSNSPNPKAALVSAALSLTTSDGVSSTEANHVKEKQGIPQPQCSIFPDADSQSTSHVPSSIRNLQSSQFVSQHIPQTSSAVLLESLPSVHTLSGKKEFPEGHGSGPAVISHSGPSEQKFGVRKEFPQHFFATTYSSVPVQSPGWQPVQAQGMGNGLQYSSAVQVPTVYQPANTFDLNNGTHLLQSPMLSSMSSWHGTKPNVLEARSLLQSSSVGSPCTQWMPAQSSPYGAVPFQPSSSTLGMPLSSHMGQQVPSKLPPAGYQGIEVLGNNLAVFSTLNTSQHPGGRFCAIQGSSSSVGGNPFA
ncbi:hypothetical protein CRYUN_Cryun32bG0095700 [Craigia yunnanensis]